MNADARPSPPAPPASNASATRRPAALLPLTVAIPAVSAVMIALLWWLTIASVRHERETELASHLRASTNLTRAFEEHSTRTINLIDQALVLLQKEIESGRTIDLQDFFTRNSILQSGMFLQVALIGADGRLKDSNIRPFQPVDLSDREHFRVHLERPSNRLFVGKPVMGRVSKKWSIQTSRRVNRPDGSLAGVLVGSVDPLYFASFYGDVDLGPGGVVSLVGMDGIVRARRSALSNEPGQDLRGSGLFQELGKRNAGHFTAPSRVDSVERIYTYRTFKDYPLVVAIGGAVHDVFAGYETRKRNYLTIGASGTLLIALVGTLLYVLARRQQAERERAEASSRMKSEFLAHVSHELRTPLHGILGFSDFLRRRLADPVEKESAELVHQSGSHLLAIVNSILDLAKIEAGKLELAPAAENLRSTLESVAANYRIVAEAKHLAFMVEIDPALDARFRFDRTRLVSMLNNLLDNAVKFTERGMVRLEAHRDGTCVRFVVTDSGTGIPLALQEAIFEKFRQADAFVTRRHGGTGLGLALVRELAALMHGEVSVHSSEGTGSSFTLRIPMVAESTESEKREKETA